MIRTTLDGSAANHGIAEPCGCPARSGQKLRLVLGAVLAAGLIAALLVSRFGMAHAAAWSQSVLRWADAAGSVGWLLFVAVQALVAMVGIVPASLLGIAAGGVYGLLLGFALAASGTLVGGWAAFLMARSLLRPWVARMLARRTNSRLVQLDAAVASDGWRFVCLLRISPVMPFALTSYALGLTKISGRDYLLGTLASLPALAGYVALGALVRFGAFDADTGIDGALHWGLLALGGVATAVLVVRSGTLLARCGLLPNRSRV